MDDHAIKSPHDLFTTDLESVRANWGWYLASGIAFFLFGVIALSFSVLVTLASVVVFGWMLLFGGIFETIHAFKTRRWSGFFVEAVIGILYVVVGGMMVFNPGVGALSLTLLMAAFFLVGGTFRIVGAAVLRPPSWGLLIVSGAVTLLLGILIWAEWPASAFWVIGLFVGIDMIFSGSWLVMLALGVRKVPPLVDRADTSTSSSTAAGGQELRRSA
ncbi:MAG TPA: HdeD family acid-resistance protein [Nitrospira sp.]|nr:HdeD family acid-resistance protein [Nitrospira sp.]